MENRKILSLFEIGQKLYYDFNGFIDDDLYGWQYRKGKSFSDIREAVRLSKLIDKLSYLKFLERELYKILKPNRELKKIAKYETLSLSQVKVLDILCKPYKTDMGNKFHHPKDEFKSNTLESLRKKGLVEYYEVAFFVNGAVRITEKGRINLQHHIFKNKY